MTWLQTHFPQGSAHKSHSSTAQAQGQFSQCRLPKGCTVALQVNTAERSLPCTALTSLRAVPAQPTGPAGISGLPKKHHRGSTEPTGSSHLPHSISASCQANSAPDWGAASIPGAVLNRSNSLCPALGVSAAQSPEGSCSTEPLINPSRKGPSSSEAGLRDNCRSLLTHLDLSSTTSVLSFCL